MSDDTANGQDDQDQDAEPTMTAPAEGRPDGTVPPSEGLEDGPHAQDADDQLGSEEPTG